MRRTIIELPEELHARLRAEAARQHTSISDLARQAIERHLSVKPRLLAGNETRRSGEPDISERIEELLRAEWGSGLANQ